MANEAGVVKSVTGGSVRALNNATGEVRNLSVGDIVYQNEKIITDSADSKVTITQTDGKEITLIGKDTITLDQDTGNNQTVADISALQQAILNGTDLNALEETAAGGPQAGNAGGDGVSLGAASFAEGGHYSNISENFRNLNGSGRNFESPISSVGGYADGAAGTDVTTPVVPVTPAPTVTMLESEAKETKAAAGDEYLIYNIKLAEAKTTFNLNVAATSNNAGNDYSRNLEYSFDGGNTWQPLVDGKISANRPAPIQNIQVRIKVIDDDGRINGNQNEGVKAEDRGAAFGADDYGVYKNGVTLSVTDGNSASASATGNIIDNDDILTANKFLDGKHINTEDGEDTITINNGARNSTIDAGTNSDKIIMNNDTTIEQTNIIAGEGDDRIDMNNGVKFENSTIDAGVGGDTINVNAGAKVRNSTIYTKEGSDTTNINGGTVTSSEINLGNNTADKRDVVNVNSGSTLTDTVINGKNALGNDEINLKAGSVSHNIGINTGAGNDTINMSGKLMVDRDTDDILIKTGEGNDTINIDGGEITGSRTRPAPYQNVPYQVQMETGTGDDTVNIKNRASLKDVSIITGTSGIPVGGNDTVNITDNSKLEHVNINLQRGTDTVNVKNATLIDVAIDSEDDSVDGINTVNVDNSSLDQTKIYTGDDNDIINIRNTIINDDKHGAYGTIIKGEGGSDTINIESSKIFGEKAYIDADSYGTSKAGNDILNIKDSTIDGIKRIYTGGGNDDIHITNSTISNVEDADDSFRSIGAGDGNDTMTLDGGTKIINTNIGMGAGNDTINIESGTILDRTIISGGTDNDTFKLGKGIDLSNNVKLDGGAGNDDTLQISENIDFSKVSNFEHLKLGADNESVDLKNLSIGDVLNITGNKDTVLKIDGDRSDHLSLKGFNNTPVSNHDGYDRYEGFDSYGNTISIDIKQGVAIDFY